MGLPRQQCLSGCHSGVFPEEEGGADDDAVMRLKGWGEREEMVE